MCFLICFYKHVLIGSPIYITRKKFIVCILVTYAYYVQLKPVFVYSFRHAT